MGEGFVETELEKKIQSGSGIEELLRESS